MGEFVLDAATLQRIHEGMNIHEWTDYIRMRGTIRGRHTYWVQTAYRECVCGKVEDAHGR